MKLSKNFNLIEFACKDGTPYPQEWIDSRLKFLLRNLQKIRDEFKSPISIVSAYRTPAHNKKVGGAKNSFHVQGMAVDLVPLRDTVQNLHKTILSLVKEGKISDGGIAVSKSFVHYDLGPARRWKYGSKK
jgi:uncharacterized protein YcbK (DUF882 family)